MKPRDVLLSAVLLGMLIYVLPALWQFTWVNAVFVGEPRAVCLAVTGACWPLIAQAWRIIIFDGLATTLLTACTAFALALPLATYLGWRRYKGGILSAIYIETVRGLPAVVVIFAAAVLLPLLLPAWALPNKFWRVLLALALFQAAYLAEVIRGGLLAVSHDLQQAAAALAMSKLAIMRHIVLPLATRAALPSMINCFLGLLKDTSLLMLAGVTDFLAVVETLASDPARTVPQAAATVYLFAALVYGLLCAVPATLAAYAEYRLRMRVAA